MTEKIRIGAVNYLNTKPLVYELEALAPNAELVLDYPSRLADQMARGELAWPSSKATAASPW